MEFLDDVDDVAVADRLAVLDNDGTMWCEKPRYMQHEFLIWAVADRQKADDEYEPSSLLRDLVHGDMAEVKKHSIADVTTAMNSIFEGLTPDEFTERVSRFAAHWRSERFDRAVHELRFQPMLELLAALRRRDFDVYIVTGGGLEFVRGFAPQLYGVPIDRTIGSLVDYRWDADHRTVRRGSSLQGSPDEGTTKVQRIQQVIGRRPILAAGNSAGDAEMLDYANASDGPTMALLIDHDDDEREFSYRSVAASFDSDRDIVDVGRDAGWTIASMRRDWATVFVARDDASPERT